MISGPFTSRVSQYALPFSMGKKSLQYQTPSRPARVSYLGGVVGFFLGASFALAPSAILSHHSYPCSCSTSVSNLMTLPRLPSGSLTQKVVRPSTCCQPVGVSVPASKSPLATRFLAPGLIFGFISFGGAAATNAARTTAIATGIARITAPPDPLLLGRSPRVSIYPSVGMRTTEKRAPPP